MCMKINTNHNQSFGCKRLYSAKIEKELKTGVKQVFDVFVSELEKTDYDRIFNKNLAITQTKLGGQILTNFMSEAMKNTESEIGKGKRYLVIEAPTLPDEERFLGIGLAEVFEKYIWISKLQSLKDEPKYKKFKGIGTSLMHAIIDIAKKNEKKCVALSSLPKAVNFYRNLSFFETIPMTLDLNLRFNRYDNVLKSTGDRFSIKSLNE